MNKLKYHFLGGLVFLGTIVFGYIGYTAYTNLATQVDGATITKDIWNDVINKVNTIGNTYAPPGAIMAFYLSSCPTGRIIADGTNGTPDLRGEFIRGLDYGRGVDNGRTLGSWQKGSALLAPWKTDIRFYMLTSNNNNAVQSLEDLGIDNNDNRNIWNSSATNIVNGTSTGTSVNYTYGNARPRNVALLYCMKQ